MSWPESVSSYRPRTVLEVASRLAGLPVEVITGQSRDPQAMTVRHLAMAAARQISGSSFPEIGRAFGRDHSSVMHAVKKVRSDEALSKDCAVLVEEVRRSFGTMARPGDAVNAPGRGQHLPRGADVA